MNHVSRQGLALLLGACALAAHAGEGHDHDHDRTAAAPAAEALPRFAAHSDLFELVGVLDGRLLTLYLDHAADNRPAAGAQLTLELGGAALAVTAQGEGLFQATLPAAPAEGGLAVAATVQAGAVADVLAAELDVHHGDAHAEGAAAGAPWPRVAAAALAAVLAGAAALWGWRRRAGQGGRA